MFWNREDRVIVGGKKRLEDEREALYPSKREIIQLLAYFFDTTAVNLPSRSQGDAQA
jgi:hypothetical protein